MRWLTKQFLAIDPRTLGLARIFIALLLLLDLAKRTGEIHVWYGNTGLLPNHTGLWRPWREWQFSWLWGFARWEEAALGFLLCGAVYVGLLVGYRTRVCQILSLVCLISLQVRVDILSNGGDFVFCLLLWWTVFLPLGARFSLDALRNRSHPGIEDAPTQPVVSLAVLAAMLQLSVIYFFNAVHKSGPTWYDGTAVHWVLQQERIITAFGVWLREHVPLSITRALTYGALGIEGVLPLLILSPFGRPWTRRLAILLIWMLHLGIASMMNLGVFSLVMCVFATLLVSTEDWNLLERWLARSGNPWKARTQAWVHQLGTKVYGVGEPVGSRQPRGRSIWLREACVAFLLVVAVGQVLVENRAVPASMKPAQLPKWMRATVSYTRMQQGWGMFAPDGPRSEMGIVVDARTVDGRRVDPYNAVAGRVADPSLRRVQTYPDYNVYWVDYTARIAGSGIYHPALKEWILAHHKRTGRPEDRIVQFDAYVVEQDGHPDFPAMASNFRSRKFLTGASASDR